MEPVSPPVAALAQEQSGATAQDHGEMRGGLKTQLRLDGDLVNRLKTVHTGHAVFSLFSTWAMAALGIWIFVALSGPWRWAAYPFLVVFMARTQHALAILMHDASHRSLFAQPRLNDWVGRWLCAYPLFISLFAYRKLHFRHHKDLYTPRDPDIPLYTGYPRTALDLAGKFGKDLLGLTVRKNFLYLMGAGLKRSGAGPGGKNSRDLWEIALFNGVLWVGLVITGWWWVYLALWLAPLLTVLQVVLRFRGCAEHAAVPDENNPVLNVRTTLGNPVSRFLVAPLFVNHHLEHHLYPAVPHYHLPGVHHALKEKGALSGALICPGYFALAKSLLKRST